MWTLLWTSELVHHINLLTNISTIIISEKIINFYKQSNVIENFGCKINELTGPYLNDTLPTIYFIKCGQVEIQLNVFRTRGDYFWVGEDKSKKSTPKFFGDVPRGINR